MCEIKEHKLSNKQKKDLIGILNLLKKRKVVIRLDLEQMKGKEVKEINEILWDLILQNSVNEEEVDILKGMLK